MKTKQLLLRSTFFIFALFLTRSLKNLILFITSSEDKFNVILPSGFLYKWNLLKAFAVIIIVFILYNKDILANIKFPKKLIIKQSVLNFLLANLLLIIYYFHMSYLNKFPEQNMTYWLFFLSSTIFITLYVYFLAVAFYTKLYLKKIYNTFKSQFVFFGIFFFITLSAFVLFTKTWLFFSTIITIILALLFQPFYPTSFRFLENGPQMTIADFSVTIGSPCSGIDSMLLFTAFFLAIISLDFKKINKKRAIFLFIAGFIGVYLINILRLFLLMLVGIHISPEFAVGLFHTNAGWLLFVIYFLAFYAVTKKYLYKQ